MSPLWSRLTVTLSIGIWAVAGGANVVLADKNGKNSAQEKKDDAKVKEQTQQAQKAQDELKNELQDLNKAENELAQAMAKVKAAGQKEQGVRDRVSAKHERVVGIDKALSVQEAAKKAYEEIADPLLAKLKETAAYKGAKTRVEAGHAELKKIRGTEGLSFEERKRLEAAASANALAVANLEKEALQGDPKAIALKEKHDAAAKHVADLRAKIKSEVDRDSEVRAAEQETQKARQVVETAQAKVNKERHTVEQARAKLAKEARDVAAAKAADKANDNKKSNNKGKKK